VTAVEVPPATEPGVYELDDAAYFGGPLARTSLSSTGVRELLTCPAKFRYRQQHGRPDTRAFDVGHAAHCLVLGEGPELVRIDADKWLTKAVKEEVAAVRERGAVPLRPADWDAVHGMAAAIQDHPHAPKLFSRGVPERTLVWRDEATGVLCRLKADWLRPDGLVDYKSCDKADLDSLRKSVWNYGYYIQAAFYLRGFRARFDAEPFFAFVAQEKDAPWLVQTFQLREDYLAYGDRKCAEALALYARCAEADEWPGYPTDDIPEIEAPAWARTEEY
jgi:hypothetical protein